MSKLTPHDVVGNCRIAFDAAESLGIPRVIEPRDMSLLAVPDKLAVMTYLHQLRAHFTGKQLQIEQIGRPLQALPSIAHQLILIFLIPKP